MEINNTDQKQSIQERYNISPLVFGIVSLITIFISYQLIGGIAIYTVGEFFGAGSSNFDRTATMAGQLLFLLVPTFLMAKLLPYNFKEIFKLNKVSFILCLWAILGIFALMHISQIILLLQAQIPLPESIKSNLYELKNAIEEVYKKLVYADNIFELGLVIIVVAVVPSFCEEFLFRGLLQHSFTAGLDARKGIIITGLLFAVFHFNPFSFIALVIIGIYLCFLAYKTNSIIPSIVGHFSNNLAAVTVPYFLGRDDLVVITEDTNTLFTVNDIISLAFIFLLSLGLFAVSLFMVLKHTAVYSTTES